MAEQLVFDLPQRAAMGRAAFLVSDSNREAVALIDGFGDWQVPVQWIYGPTGSGKSHLAAVLSHQCAALNIDAVQLLQDDIARVLDGSEKPDAVIVVRLDALPAHCEEVLFHLLNFSRHENLKILLLSEKPAAQLTIGLPDLVSRLKAVAAVALTSPDDALMRGLMAKLMTSGRATGFPGFESTLRMPKSRLAQTFPCRQPAPPFPTRVLRSACRTLKATRLRSVRCIDRIWSIVIP